MAGSAVVAAEADTSVAVMNIHQATPYTAGSYTGLANASTTIRLPLLHRNNYGWYSDFTVFNAGSTSTDLTVTFTPATAGYPCTQTYSNVPPNGSRNVDLTYVTCVGSTFVGSARVTSSNGQSLAAVATQWKDYTGDGNIDSFMLYEGFPTTFNPLPFPLLMRNNWNWNTGLVLQNASDVSNNARLDFYHQADDGGGWCDWRENTMGGNGAWIINPAPPDGPCTSNPAWKVFAGVGDGVYSQPKAGIVNQVNSTAGSYNAMSYSSPSGGTTTAVVPLVLKNYDWRGRNDWKTGLGVQNMGSSGTTVTVRYYNEYGGEVTPSDSKWVPSRSTGIFNPVPLNQSSFRGSAVVTAGQPIAVVVNVVASGGSADAFMSYSGVNR